MTKRLLKVIPFIFVIALVGVMVVLLVSLEDDNRNDPGDSILIEQATEFCDEWLKVSCDQWAIEIVEEHAEVMHLCLSEYAPDSLEAYGCVLDGVYE